MAKLTSAWPDLCPVAFANLLNTMLLPATRNHLGIVYTYTCISLGHFFFKSLTHPSILSKQPFFFLISQVYLNLQSVCLSLPSSCNCRTVTPGCFFHVCRHLCMHAPQCVCVGHRTTYRNRFSPFCHSWVSGLSDSAVTHWAILPASFLPFHVQRGSSSLLIFSQKYQFLFQLTFSLLALL